MNEIPKFSIILLGGEKMNILNISQSKYEMELTILLLVMLFIILAIICLTIVKKVKDK